MVVDAHPSVNDALRQIADSVNTLGQEANAQGFLHSGTGVPVVGNEPDGSFYFRQDGTAGTLIYVKVAGVWTAML